MKKSMIVQFANAYVRFLLALAILLFAAVLVLHVKVLIGATNTDADYGKMLILGNLTALFPIFFFPKDRNIWQNEFKSCPRWMRIAVVILAVYGLVVCFLGVIIVPVGNPVQGDGLSLSAFFLGFDAISICIPYSVIWTAPLEQSELIRRTRNSVIAVALAVIVSSAYHAGYFPHPSVENQKIESQP
jgi:hypothetical protein